MQLFVSLPGGPLCIEISAEDFVTTENLYASPGVWEEEEWYKTLKPKQWLSCRVLQDYKDLISPPEGYTDVCVVDTWYADRVMDDKEESYVAEKLRRMLRKRALPTPSKIIAMVGQSNTHWYLLCYDVGGGKVYCFDSLATGISKKHRLVEAKLRKALEATKMYAVSFQEMAPVALFPTCPQQNNGHDCGVYTCIIARLICEGRLGVISQLPGELGWFRKLILAEIKLHRLLCLSYTG